LQPDDVQKWGDLFGSFDSSQSFQGVGSAVPDDPTSIDPGINPSGSSGLSTSTTDPSGGSASGDDLFFGLTSATRLKVESECRGQILAYVDASARGDEVAYYQSVRSAFGCAAVFVPGYTECLPLIDDVVTLARTDPNKLDLQIDEMWSCTDGVSG